MGAIAAAVIAAVGTGYGIYANQKAQSRAEEQAKAQQKAQAKALAGQQEALSGLYGEQQDPAEVFASIFSSYPDLLAQVLPSLTHQSIDTASQLTDANVASYQRALAALNPDYASLRADQVAQIRALNPENLGAEDIAAITRLSAPIIPVGTFDPNTGAVAGGTTNPVSLYRNLISGKYDERRTSFLNADNIYLTDAQNSALRQQVQAQNFLLPLLQDATQAASGLTSSTVQQQSGNIAAQTSLLNTVLGMPAAQVNLLPYSQANSQLVQSGASNIGALLRAIQSSNTTAPQSYSTVPAGSYNLDYYPSSSTQSGSGSTTFLRG